MAGKDIKPRSNLPSTNVGRRDVLRGTAGTVGKSVLPSIPNIVKDFIPTGWESVADPHQLSIGEHLAALVTSMQELQWHKDLLSTEDWILPEAFGGAEIDEIMHGQESIASQLEDTMSQIDWEQQDDRKIPLDEFNKYKDAYDRVIPEMLEYESSVLDNMTDLKIAFKNKYPKDFVDWLFNTPSGQIILSSTKDMINDEYTAPRGADIKEIDEKIVPELLERAAKQFEIDKEEQQDYKETTRRIYNPDLKDLPEESPEDVVTIPTFRGLRRALEKLGAPRQLKQPEAPKQIESKSPVQMANIASALNRFKRATPIGAAAAMYQPSPAGEGSDIVPPYPLIRPQF